MKFKSEYYWLLLFACCFIAYQQIQDNIRPQYSGANFTIKYLLGVAPNFFPAIGIPAIFVVLIPQFFRKNNSNSWVVKNIHLSSNFLSASGLIIWEFMQLSGKLRFDWNDILWTLIGAFMFNKIWMISPKKYKTL